MHSLYSRFNYRTYTVCTVGSNGYHPCGKRILPTSIPACQFGLEIGDSSVSVSEYYIS